MSEQLPFESVYRHGFARVAACTIPVAIGDPARNAQMVMAAAREAHDAGVAVAVTLGGSAVRLKKLMREAPSYLTACGLALRRFLP